MTIQPDAPQDTPPEGDLSEPLVSAAPVPKVAAAGVAGALTTLVVFVLAQADVEITAEVAAALTTLVAFAAGYLRRDGWQT